MYVRCLKCDSKLSVVKELIKIKSEKLIAKVETKCRKCKIINCYLIPTHLHEIKDK